MVEQTDLLKYAVATLERLGIPYALVGSYASGIWGESRFTQDIDILIRLPSEAVGVLCAAFPPPDFYVSEAAAFDAVKRRGQFNVIHPASGNKIDFMIAGDGDWTANHLSRTKRIRIFPDQVISVAAPEDVIVGKLIYYRDGGSDKHLRDIRGILKVTGDMLDVNYLTQRTIELGLSDEWNQLANM